MSKKKRDQKKRPKLKAMSGRVVGRGMRKAAPASPWVDRLNRVGQLLASLAAWTRPLSRFWLHLAGWIAESGPGLVAVALLPLLAPLPVGTPVLMELFMVILAVIASALVLTERFARSQYRFIRSPVDLALLLPLLALTISLFASVNLRAGLQGAFLAALLYLAYWSLSRSVGEDSALRRVPLRLLSVGGAAWALVWTLGLSQAPPGAPFLLAASALAAFHLADPGPWTVVPYLSLSGLALLPSPPGLLVALAASVAAYAASGPEARPQLAGRVFLALAAAAAALILSQATGLPWVGLAAGAAVAIGLGRLVQLPRLTGAGPAALAIGLALIIYLGQTWLTQGGAYLGVQLADALSMARDRPLLGAGSGAWDSLYRSYRSFAYAAPGGPPSAALGWLLNTGLVGLALALAAGAALIREVLPSAPEGRVPWGLLSAVLLGWVLLPPAGAAGAAVLAVAAGLAVRPPEPRSQADPGYLIGPRLVAYGLLLAVGLAVLTLATGSVLFLRGEGWMARGQTQRGYRLLSQAVAYDSLSGQLQSSVGWTERSLGLATESGELLSAAADSLRTARRLEPANPDYHAMYARLARDVGWDEEAEEGFLRALETDTRNPDRYEDLAAFYSTWAQRERGWGEAGTVQEQLEGCLQVASLLEERLADEPDGTPPDMSLRRARGPVNLYLGQITAMDMDFAGALEKLELALEAGDVDEAEAELWMGVVHEARGEWDQADGILEPLLQERPDLKEHLDLARYLLDLAELED